MQKINSSIELRNVIAQLESTQAVEEKILREQLHLTYESMKPINLLKNAFSEVATSQDLRDNLINTTVGVTAGYLSKKLFEGVSHSPLRKLLGTALMFGITNVVAKNPEAIKAAGNGILKIITAIKHPPIERPG